MNLVNIPFEYQYIVVLLAVLLIPKILLRFQIPTGITSLILGVISINLLGWFQDSQAILLLSRLGITSLFLFAGMEIDLSDLMTHKRPLISSLVQSIILVVISSYFLSLFIGLSFQVCLIISTAIFTPSAGFILSSLKSFELVDDEIFWIKLKAISKEIVAVLILFVALKMQNPKELVSTSLFFILMVALLYPLFKFYLRFIAPYAPKTEVSFLVVIALVAGVIMKKLGTYYLVGAFAVGIIAGQFKHFTQGSEARRIEDSLQAFYIIFIPFYFFKTGLLVTKEFFTLQGLWIGLGLILIMIPLRLVSVISSIKFFLPEFWKERWPIAVNLIPNLIFGLVVVSILKTEYDVSPAILSGILFYTLVASIIPAIYLQRSPPESYDLSRIRRKS